MPENIDESLLPHLSAFERIKHHEKDGREWWSARELIYVELPLVDLENTRGIAHHIEKGRDCCVFAGVTNRRIARLCPLKQTETRQVGCWRR
jgi:hypothetical protein